MQNDQPSADLITYDPLEFQSRFVMIEYQNIRADGSKFLLEIKGAVAMRNERFINAPQRSDHVETLGFFVPREPAFDAVYALIASDSDDEVFAKLGGIGQELNVPGVEHVETAGSHN